MSRSRCAGAALLAGLVLAAAAYWPALQGEFQYDDIPAIADNARVKVLPRAFDGFLARYAGGRPVTDLTFALDHAWSGVDPRGYHLTNLALHLGVALLVFALSRLLLRRAGLGGDAAAATAAALFALHPINSQAVAYLAQRSEVLASLLYLGSLLALLAADARWGSRRGLALYALAAATFALALGAKPVSATLPIAFLLIQYGLPASSTALPGSATARGGPPASGRARPMLLALPFLLGSAALAWMNIRSVSGREDAGFDIPALGPGAYLLTQARVVTRYLSLLVWPAGQNLDYDFAVSRGPLDPPATLAAVALLCLLVATAALAWRRAGATPSTPSLRAARLAAVGLCWFLILLAPSSSFLPLADLIEEHRPYLASFGPLLGVVGALSCLAEGRSVRWRRLLLAGTLLLCLGLAVALHARARIWSSRLTLWADVAQKSPGKARAHMSLGHALEQAGRLEEAVAEYQRVLALAVNPVERTSSQAVFRHEVLRNLGSTFIKLHRLDDASAALREGIALAPANTDLLTSLAVVELDRGNLDAAEDWANRALVAAPDDGRAFNAFGEVRFARGDVVVALEAFRRAASLDPDNPVRAFNTGMAADKLGRVAEACGEYARYLRLRAHTGEPDLDVSTRRRELGCDLAATQWNGAEGR